MERKYITAKEAAEYLGLDVETIRRFHREGLLKSYKLKRALRFTVEDLDNFMANPPKY